MFTGLVETIGTVLEYNELDSTSSGGNGVSMVIGNCSEILGDVHLGDSICTNGVCLTKHSEDRIWGSSCQFACEFGKSRDFGSEARWTCCSRPCGYNCNNNEKVADGNAIAFTFQLRERENISYIVEKGFIAIDGTSLTVTHVDYDTAEFSIMLVSYSQEKVILSKKEVGHTVNIEVDFTGKLIEKQIELTLEASSRSRILLL
ncbi:hypothetical protein CJJ09_003737 [Candidozyma auris]|nr:hypothetical protein CJJ09_003737 [[Candida] auris]